MSSRKPADKASKQLAVSKAILEVVEREGLNGITHAKVARKAGVSRAWIYSYIGKEKPGLIKHAAETLAEHFSRMDRRLVPSTQQDLAAQSGEAIRFLFDSAADNPAAIKLYYGYRGTANSLGLAIRKYEAKWLESARKGLSKALGLKEGEAKMLAEAVMLLRLGYAHRIATSDNKSRDRDQALQAFGILHALIAQATHA